MRGFLMAAVVLIGLDVALKAPSSRLAAAAGIPARWLAAWMDPNTPLIAKPPPDSGGTRNANPGVPAWAGSAAPGTPPLGYPPASVETVKPVNGVCPTGYRMGSDGMCHDMKIAGQVGG